MADRRIIEVVPSNTGWAVVEPSGSRYSSWRVSQKLDAVADGIALANLCRPSRLVIRDAEGAVETERVYGEATD